MMEAIGTGAVTAPVSEVKNAEVAIVIGARPGQNHPVAATFMKNAAKEGKTLIVMDPKQVEIARHANHFLQFKPDTDVALLNAIMKSIIDQNLVDAYLARRILDHLIGFKVSPFLWRHISRAGILIFSCLFFTGGISFFFFLSPSLSLSLSLSVFVSLLCPLSLSLSFCFLISLLIG